MVVRLPSEKIPMANKTITTLKGVYASGMAAGIKSNGKKDLAFVYVPNAFGSAGVFTVSAFAAPPLTVCKKALSKGVVKAVIINSGNANAGTGRAGLRDAERTAAIAAKLLGIKPSQVAVSSTGIIGKPLPMKQITDGLTDLLAKPLVKHGDLAAQAIMTTDLTRKEVFVTGTVGGEKITIAGFAKGSGMIAPNMATMLGFLATDATVDSKTLQALLRVAVDASFNMTSVDTDTSTNDMVMVFSTGEKGRRITSSKHKAEFLALLTRACQELSKQIAADGEGATKLIEVRVEGARNLREARCIAKNVINSPLVKTAIHGADPNWGRVLAAAGKDPSAKVDPNRVDLTFAGASVMRKGKIVPHDRARIKKRMEVRTVPITIRLNLGKASATAWGCDLTHGYVDINVSYN
jgi:glutamate N-acetyltransferase/amino-acid N-acetyltransferase